jgi:membrane-associated phospholipid phosphatase
VAGRHSLAAETAILIGLYLAYDAGRGLAGGGRRVAVAHALSVTRAEKNLGLFVEPHIQHAARSVPGLDDLFGFGYDSFHLGVTVSVLAWLYLRRPHYYPMVRNAVVTATGLALAGFAVYPTAPPRLAGIGVADSLRLAHRTSESGLLRILYNPYAAMPSLHIAFAVLVSGSVLRTTSRRSLRILAAVYPIFVTLEVIATGNHFVLDVTAGLVVAAVAAWSARRIAMSPTAEVDPETRMVDTGMVGAEVGARPGAAIAPWEAVDPVLDEASSINALTGGRAMAAKVHRETFGNRRDPLPRQ